MSRSADLLLYCGIRYDGDRMHWAAFAKPVTPGIPSRSYQGLLEQIAPSGQENAAEGIALGLAAAAKDGLLLPRGAVMVHTDCHELIAVLLKMVPDARSIRGPDGQKVEAAKRPGRSFRESIAIPRIAALTAGADVQLLLRHLRNERPTEARSAAQ